MKRGCAVNGKEKFSEKVQSVFSLVKDIPALSLIFYPLDHAVYRLLAKHIQAVFIISFSGN